MTVRKTADKIVVGDVLVWPTEQYEVGYVYHGRNNTIYLQFSGGIWAYSSTHVFDVEPKAETWRDREKLL